MQLLRTTRLGVLAQSLIACILTAISTTTFASSGVGVYFLGVDTQPVLASEAEDRWQYSAYARQMMQEADVSNLMYSLADWQPLDDPFNVGVIIVRSLNTTSESFRDQGFRYYSSADLAWVHIGQDLQGVGMSKPFPEVRGFISYQHTAVGQGSEPLTEDEIRILERKAVEYGIRSIAKHIAEYQVRSNIRNALDIRYVSVESAAAGARAFDNLSHIYGSGGAAQLELLQQRIARVTESLLIRAVNRTSDLKHVVVLPGSENLELMAELWPQYARRVFAQSENSGARRVLGREPPRMRVVSAGCKDNVDSRVIPVSGWNIRTTLAALEVESSEASSHVTAHRVRLGTAAALRAADPARSDDYKPDLVVGLSVTDSPLLRPNDLSVADALNDYEISLLLRASLQDAVEKLAGQLGQLQDQPISTMLNKDACHENS